MAYPVTRLRRLRRHRALRDMVAETALSPADLIAPLFVREGIDEPQPIASLPGVVQHTVESLVKEARRLASLGVPALVLFGVPAHKDAVGSGASDPDGIVQVALRRLADELGDGHACSSPTCASTSTPTTATAASSTPAARSTTTPPSTATPRWPWPRPRPGPTWSPRRG